MKKQTVDSPVQNFDMPDDCDCSPAELAERLDNFVKKIQEWKGMTTVVPYQIAREKCKLCDNPRGSSDPLGQYCDEHYERFCAAWYAEPSPLKLALKEMQGKPEKVKVTVEELRKLL